LFLDGSHFKYHADAAAEPVLAAWGIDTDGKPVFIGLEAASSESGDAWKGFLTGLGERGLACPLLVISDCAAGLVGAIERTMSAARRQRCLIHRGRNIVAKVSKHDQAEVKADDWAIFDLPDTIAPGPNAVAIVQQPVDRFAQRWRCLPRGSALPAGRPRIADGVPAIPPRALAAYPALQLNRTHLR
jgi:putative transposase